MELKDGDLVFGLDKMNHVHDLLPKNEQSVIVEWNGMVFPACYVDGGFYELNYHESSSLLPGVTKWVGIPDKIE